MSDMSSGTPQRDVPGGARSTSAGTAGRTPSATELTPERRARVTYEAFNARDMDMLADQYTEDCELLSEPSGERFTGRDGVKRYMQRWITAFPDGMVTVTNVVPAGNTVVLEFRGRGTQTGTLDMPAGRIAPTGRTAEVPFCEVLEFANGRIARQRSYYDAATMARQLGLGG